MRTVYNFELNTVLIELNKRFNETVLTEAYNSYTPEEGLRRLLHHICPLTGFPKEMCLIMPKSYWSAFYTIIQEVKQNHV